MVQSISQSVREDEKLGRELVLDELFDLILYRRLVAFADENTKKLLATLIVFEERHLAFWQKFFNIKSNKLGMARRLKLIASLALCRIFKTPAIHLVLEAIEIYGIRKYLQVWEAYQGKPLGKAVEEILRDELKHEDAIVSKRIDRAISPEHVRSIFLGFNDGLVEILGAISGFFAAFESPVAVLAAGFTVAAAGSISMGAGVFVAMSSEEEVERTEEGKKQFLSGQRLRTIARGRSLGNAFIVGISYFIGAMIPIAPVFLGAKNIAISGILSAIMIAVVSFILAFLSGMEVRRRIVINIIIISLAVGISYGIGVAAKEMLGAVI